MASSIEDGVGALLGDHESSSSAGHPNISVDLSSSSSTIQVDFEDMFKTPKFFQSSTLSTTCGHAVNKFYRNVYSWCLDLTYYALVILLGYLLIFVWGMTFGVMTFIAVWFLQPLWKLILVPCSPCINSISVTWANFRFRYSAAAPAAAPGP